jgi:hypothetical protein
VKLLYLLLIALSPIIIPSQPALPPAQDFPDVCQEPDNILPNCNFNNGLDGWVPYLENGSANISTLQGGGECHAPLCPAAYIVTEGSFVGGIYQQVPVTPGNTYYANIVWLAFDSIVNDPSINAAVGGGIGRRVGIDPTGGTDSTSSTVIWSEDNWRNDCKICNVEYVTATAQADKITVFIRIDDTWRVRAAEKGFSVPPGRDQFWLDDIGMKQIAGDAAPPPTEPPPTDTPPPPPANDTPVPEPAVDAATTTDEGPTSTPPPAETPAEVARLDSPAEQSNAPAEAAEEPESPLATPQEPAREIAPPPTLTPSATPSPSPTFERRATPTATRPAPPETARTDSQPPALSAGLLGTIGTTACLGGVVLVVLGGVLGGAVWLYRLGWGQTDDDAFDDVEEIPVEVVE